MNRYIENLKSFLVEQSPNFCFDDAKSMLDMLCYYYCSANPVDNAVIRCQFKVLNDIVRPMTVEESDAVFSVVCDLCLSYERQAFLDGLRAGMRLFSELSGPSMCEV